VRVFFEGHDPPQKMRQGNDVGTQYRSAICTTSREQAETACRVADRFGESLRRAGYRPLATEIAPAGPFFYAEPYHQQYLEANPGGYCGLVAPASRARSVSPRPDETVTLAFAPVSGQRRRMTLPVISVAASEAR
jgi:peptide methionine sulfoxide reductase MsrA